MEISLNSKNYEYSYDSYGFLKQVNPEPFNYDVAYKYKQSTNIEMVKLRLGYLALHLKEDFSKMRAVDIGAGNNVFINYASHYFKSIVPYDLDGESISKEELHTTHWDIIFLTDVLEHFTDIDDLWKINFNYAYISFPEYPKDYPLDKYKHCKVNEHIYQLNEEGFTKFVKGKAEIIAISYPEDLIRTRWDENYRNITSVIIKRS